MNRVRSHDQPIGLRRTYLPSPEYSSQIICTAGSIMKFDRPHTYIDEFEDYMPCGYPTTAVSTSREKATGVDRTPKRKKKSSPWDLNSPGKDLSIFTEETDTAFDDEERISGFLIPLRHQGHYFSNMDLFTNSGYNYLKYAKYTELVKSPKSNSPHLSISHLTFSVDIRTRVDRWLWRVPKIIQSLSNISMELVAGDILAVLHTTESEVRTFLRILAGESIANGKIRGEFMINGHRLKANQLEGRIAYICQENPPDHLTVYQYLQLISSYYGAKNNSNGKTYNMIDQLVVTLALTHFKNSLCCELTKSEKQRVKIASQILRDTDILVCDNIVKDMDVYDSAFVIDFLRDWALKLNRIVIMSVSPSSMGILEMFSHVSILTSGQLIYFGSPGNMMPYFESINFPCPPFKNPCDYYVDIATHDHLTPEASRDSSQRIEILCNKWKNRERNHLPVIISPLTLKKGAQTTLKSSFVLYRKYFMECFNKPFLYFYPTIFSFLISVFIGLIFLQISNEKRQEINDRFGLITSILFFSVFPISYTWLEQAYQNKQKAFSDKMNGLYSSSSYLIITIIFFIPIFMTQMVLFTIPVYFLSGICSINGTDYSFFSFFLIISFYYALLFLITFSFANLLESKLLGLFIVYSFNTTLHLSSGISIVSADFPLSLSPARLVSPAYWIVYFLLHQTFLGSSIISSLLDDTSAVNYTEIVFGCERKKILATRIDDVPIYTISTCSNYRSEHLMTFYGFDGRFLYENYSRTQFLSFGLLVTTLWLSILTLLYCCSTRKIFKRTR